MLKGVTNTFKTNCNKKELLYREYLILDGTIIPIKAKMSDDCYENGNFIGTFIFKTIKFETDATYNFKGKEFEYYKEVDGESIKMGTFITTEIQLNDTTEIVQVIGMDYGLKTQIEYMSSLEYHDRTITLLDVWNEACTMCGLESGIDDFPNSDFIVDSDQFSGTGALVRDVFKAIAMSSGTFVKVMNDDKIYLIFNEIASGESSKETDNTTTINDAYNLIDIELKGKTSQTITEQGKNILFTNLNDWESGEYSLSGTKSENARRVRTKELVPVKSNTAYYAMMYLKDISVREYDENKTFIRSIGALNCTGVGRTFTTGANAKYIGVNMYDAPTTGQYTNYAYYEHYWNDFKLIICLNSESDKSYEPYTPASPTPEAEAEIHKVSGTNTIAITNNGVTHTYSINLGTIELYKIGDYQDYIYKNGDNWYKKEKIKKVILNGSETWEKYSVSAGNLFRGSYIINNANLGGLIYCNRYRGIEVTIENFKNIRKNGDIYINPEIQYIDIVDNGKNSVADFKTWLSSHNTIVFYSKITASDILITDTNLINQLESIELSEGTNTITITGSDLVPYVKFKYKSNQLDTIEDYVELQDKRDTRPWTCLRLGVSNIDGENLDYIDEDLVAQYGEHWLILNDNPFAYNQEKRQLLIENIYNQIKTFGYSAFESKTSFKPYLTCGDVIPFRTRTGNLINTIILRYTHEYEDITLSAPSEISATVNYVYPLDAIQIAKTTQIEVNKAEGQITLLTNQITDTRESLNNYYTIQETNTLIQNATTGLTNTFSNSGGTNILRNTGLWFKDENNNYEFWTGDADRSTNYNAVNGVSILLKNNSFIQEESVVNGIYTISFMYELINPVSTASIKINEVEYSLDSENVEKFTKKIEVTTKSIKVEFICDTDDGVEIYDLMCNSGDMANTYMQNENETTTDTVNISKGITITSTNMETIFKANANGIRITTLQGNIIAYFNDKGLSTKGLIVENEAQIVKVLFQEVDDQTWITRM